MQPFAPQPNAPNCFMLCCIRFNTHCKRRSQHRNSIPCSKFSGKKKKICRGRRRRRIILKCKFSPFIFLCSLGSLFFLLLLLLAPTVYVLMMLLSLLPFKLSDLFFVSLSKWMNKNIKGGEKSDCIVSDYTTLHYTLPPFA